MNKLRSSLFLAFKSISRGNKTTIALIILIMTLAFINLVFISSILDGLLVTINDQVKTNFVSDIVIEPQKEPKRKNYIPRAENVRRQVETINGVVAAVARYSINGTIAFDKEKKGEYIYQPAQIVSIDPENERGISGIPQAIIDGQYLEEPGKGTIILGADLSGGYKPIDDPNLDKPEPKSWSKNI